MLRVINDQGYRKYITKFGEFDSWGGEIVINSPAVILVEHKKMEIEPHTYYNYNGECLAGGTYEGPVIKDAPIGYYKCPKNEGPFFGNCDPREKITECLITSAEYPTIKNMGLPMIRNIKDLIDYNKELYI
jgi:hypothetical protein